MTEKRILRLSLREAGNLDIASIKTSHCGLMECRLHNTNPALRIYFVLRKGDVHLIMLGSKDNQAHDIIKADAMVEQCGLK